MAIKSRLGEIVKERGLRQDWLAEKSGVYQGTMSRLVRGLNVPTLEVAFRIAEVLDLRIDEIWYHTNDE